MTWEKGLGKAPILPAAKNVKIYAFRQLAARFGHNAPDPSLVTVPGNGAVTTWGGFDSYGSPMDLDNAYPKIVAGSWVVFVNNDGYAEIYKLVSVTFYSRTNFGLSGKVTHIRLDTTEHLELFPRRETVVYAQSERLEMTSGPLLEPATGSISAALTRDPDLLAPIEGSVIQLDRLVPALDAGRKVLISGKLLRARVAVTSLILTSPDGSQAITLKKDDSVILTTRPSLLSGNSAKFTLRTNKGFEGTVTTSRSNLIFTPAREKDPTVTALAVVQESSGDPTVLTLQSPPLLYLFDRATVTISANVAEATHGESVSEVLGNGDASQPNQKFKLRQTPALTYTRSTAPGGRASSLQIRVNELLWSEVPTLFRRSPRERVFTTEMADAGTVTVQFGDGVRGARLPSGSQNVKATYRRGTGLDGLVRADQLTSLLTRPPGLKEANNPLAAEGADEPESFATAQQNAPVTVLTLDRVVSLDDYENFSRSYAGVAKALATWTWDGKQLILAYTDRTYTDAGMLTPRKEPNSMIKDAAQAVANVRRMVDEQAIYSTSGKRIPCQVDSICVHGDGPTADKIGRAFRLAEDHVLIAGMEPVAADSIAACLMGHDPQAATIALPAGGTCDNYLTLLHDRGVGTNQLAEIRPVGNGADLVTSVPPGRTPAGPRAYQLCQNYPNPFNPSTRITFSLPSVSDVTLRVLTLTGQQVDLLVQGTLPAGIHQVQWVPRGLASGIYFYRLAAGDKVVTRKMTMLK